MVHFTSVRLLQLDHWEGWLCQNIQGLHQFSWELLLSHLVFKSFSLEPLLKSSLFLFLLFSCKLVYQILVSFVCWPHDSLCLFIRFVISLCDRFVWNCLLIYLTIRERQNDWTAAWRQVLVFKGVGCLNGNWYKQMLSSHDSFCIPRKPQNFGTARTNKFSAVRTLCISNRLVQCFSIH